MWPLAVVACLIASARASAPASAFGPQLTVTPSTHLHDGQHVTLRWSGLDNPEQKAFFVECSSRRAAQRSLCDDGSEGAVFSVSNASGGGTADYVVHEHVFGTVCRNQCLIEVGGRDRFALAPIAFGSSTLPFTGAPTDLEIGGGASLVAIGLLMLARTRRRKPALATSSPS